MLQSSQGSDMARAYVQKKHEFMLLNALE